MLHVVRWLQSVTCRPGNEEWLYQRKLEDFRIEKGEEERNLYIIGRKRKTLHLSQKSDSVALMSQSRQRTCRRKYPNYGRRNLGRLELSSGNESSSSVRHETSCDQSEGSCSSEEEEWKSDRRSESDSESSRALHLDILIGRLTQASICSLLYERHPVDELLGFVVVQRTKCLLRIYLLQKGDERERKKISLKKRICGGDRKSVV